METTNGALNRKLRMALVGGGQGAFIGRVHATAAVLDNRAALVAGALSSDPERAKASAPAYDIQPNRAYRSVDELIEKELALPEDTRIDFISVATPNHTHFPIARAALEAGFNVICDKPMTFDLAQAEELAALVKNSGAVFAVTHNYTGYPLVRHGRHTGFESCSKRHGIIRFTFAFPFLTRPLLKTAPFDKPSRSQRARFERRAFHTFDECK
jgi:predicted dehydrogenase